MHNGLFCLNAVLLIKYMYVAFYIFTNHGAHGVSEIHYITDIITVDSCTYVFVAAVLSKLTYS